MSKHTPGPWEYTGREWGDYGPAINHERGTVAVALSFGERYEGISPEAARANAQLIAAAPDLLEACEAALVHVIQCEARECADVMQWDSEADRATAIANAATDLWAWAHDEQTGNGWDWMGAYNPEDNPALAQLADAIRKATN